MSSIHVDIHLIAGGVNASCDRCATTLLAGCYRVLVYRVSDWTNPVSGQPCRPVLAESAVCQKCANALDTDALAEFWSI